jgi:hypothetical protein
VKGVEHPFAVLRPALGASVSGKRYLKYRFLVMRGLEGYL